MTINKKIRLTAATLLTALAMSASTPEESALSALNAYMPGTTGIGKVKVESVDINDRKHTIDVKFNEAAAYVPLTIDRLAQLKSDMVSAMGDKYKNYTVKISASGKDFDELALFARKAVKGPSEKGYFVEHLDGVKAPKGLDGSNIALWQSHGWYFEPKLNRWEWQRARIFQTVEDLYTQSFVMPFLMPMLENAGAYVMSPRERDINLNEIIVDNDNGTRTYIESGSWGDAGMPGFGWDGSDLKNDQNPFRAGSARSAATVKGDKPTATAAYKADFPEAGDYAVYVSYVTVPKSTDAARYRVNSLRGTDEYVINQRMGGGTWIYLGHFPFAKGEQELPVVEVLNSGKGGKVVTTDAVKIGGGMGNVARIVKEPLDSIDYKYVKSNYPRFVEGARYFLQWAGAPDSVYTPSGNVNDYGDDYKSRGLWVNWLAGGSSMLPKREGLNIPVDLAFAFHSDAGTTLNDSIIGTLGIYCTAGGKLGNGSSRMASRDLTDLIMTNIVDDVRAEFEPNWTRRGMWDQSYYEARVPQVPSMLLELLSHQNFADMKYGLDPNFRFTVSRAIYKGMLQFLAHRDGREYVVQPLAVNSFAIAGGDGDYTLTWKATPDTIEATATPTYYIVEERVNDGAFRRVATVTDPVYKVKVTDRDIHSYRVIAANDGGVSFPGEVLALCDMPGEQVTIVNGFTRVSAPDWFEAGDGTEVAGFYDTRDHGVPYLKDISFIGSQFEFRRNIPWMDDDAAGFGASRADYEDKVVAGNTFDYVYTHGEAIKAAGRGFVSTSVEAFMNSPLDERIDCVDLILGKQKEIKQGRGVYGTRYKTFPSALQDKIKAVTAAGGDVFVSGAFVATDLWDNPNSSKEVAEADQKFATEVLGYHWRVGQATVEGEAYQVDCRFKAFTGGEYDFFSQLGSECYAVESPDSFYAPDSKKGCTIMRYTENNLVAGTAYDNGSYRTVVIGFPFETIKGADARASLMKQVIDFFGATHKVKRK